MNTRTRNTAVTFLAVFAVLSLAGCGADAPVETPAATTAAPAPSATTEAPEATASPSEPAETSPAEDEGTGFAAATDYSLAPGETSTTQRGVVLTCESREGETPELVTVWWVDVADESNGEYSEVLCSYSSETEW